MKVLLVDAMPIVYSSFSKVGHLSTAAGEPTGLRYGFLRNVRSYKERTGAEKVVIVWDTKEPVLKAQGLEDTYKTGRSNTVQQGTDGEVNKQVMFDQIQGVKDMIALTSWSQVEAPGYEADDIVGELAGRLQVQGHQPIICSTDNDLCQAVTEDCLIFIPKKKDEKKDSYKDRAWVRRQFGVEPKHVPMLRCFLGDNSDAIKGMISDKLDPFFPIDDVKAVLNESDIRTPIDLLQALRAKNEPAADSLAGHMEHFEKLWNLMRLHDPNETKKVTKGTANMQALEDLFLALEFKSMMKFLPELTR